MQIAGKYFIPTSFASPVANNTSIRIVLVLMLLTDSRARIDDLKGVFLKRKLAEGE